MMTLIQEQVSKNLQHIRSKEQIELMTSVILILAQQSQKKKKEMTFNLILMDLPLNHNQISPSLISYQIYFLVHLSRSQASPNRIMLQIFSMEIWAFQKVKLIKLRQVNNSISVHNLLNRILINLTTLFRQAIKYHQRNSLHKQRNLNLFQIQCS